MPENTTAEEDTDDTSAIVEMDEPLDIEGIQKKDQVLEALQ
jgi:hypothetical protein